MQTEAASNARPPHYLRDVLALVAENEPLDLAAHRLLELAQAATDAAGGRVLLFVEPRLSLSLGAGKTWSVTDERLAQALGDLLPGMPPEPVSFGRNGRRALVSLVAPIADERIVGGLVLLFRGEPPPDAADILTDIATGLRIVAKQARSAGRARRLPVVEQALHALPDPVVVLDAAKQVLYLNQSAESAFGIVADQAEGRPAVELPGLEPLEPAIMGDALPEEWMREGSEKVYAPQLMSLGDGYLLAFSDMTRYKKLDRNHAEFIHIVSHDLRAPLTATLLYVGMLESLLQAPEHSDKLKMVEKVELGLNVLNSHVDNIQDAGRYDPETGFYQMTRQPMDLREMAERVMSNQLISPDKSLSLSVQVDDDLPIVNVDPLMIERATMNLVDNAVKYTPAGGSIALIIRHDDAAITVCVRDTGLGIDPEDQKRLFQRHVRLRRREYHKIKGTGLGLFIVRSVALRHDGEAWVESTEGVGSTFCFSIPLAGENVAVPQV